MRLPNPNLDLSRARYLNTSTIRDEELDLVFREKLKDLRVYQDREQLANPAQIYEIQKFVVSTSEKIR